MFLCPHRATVEFKEPRNKIGYVILRVGITDVGHQAWFTQCWELKALYTLGKHSTN